MRNKVTNKRSNWCKACVRAYNQTYYKKNEEKIKKQTGDYYHANPEKAKEYNKKHIEERRERRKKYRAQEREYHRQWVASNPKKFDGYIRKRRILLATAPGGPFSVDRPDYQARKKLFGGKCAYCHKATAKHFDHAKPLSRGGTNHAGNIYPVCKSCNSKKNTKILRKEYPVRLHP